MGCYIKKYEELRKALKISNYFAIVKKGFSTFYTQPESYPDYDDVLDSLGLEIALTYYVDEFNKTYASRESSFSMEVINHMNKPTWRRSPIAPPKIYHVLHDLVKKNSANTILDNHYIISKEDALAFNLEPSAYVGKMWVELGLTCVLKSDYDAKFNAATKWGWENAKIFIDGVPLENLIPIKLQPTIDKSAKIEKSRCYLYPIDLMVNTAKVRKALEDLAEAAKKVSEKIAIDTKAYGYCVTDLDSLRFPWSQYTCSGTFSLSSDGTVQKTGKVVDGLNVDRSKTDDKLKGTWVLGASDIEDVVNSAFKKTKLYKRLEDIRFRYIGKPNTESNRMAMGSEIEEIFDEISHSTGDVNLIDGEWCECQSSPSVIVNIGSVNIDSKKEPCPTYDKLLADRITKALKSLVD